MGNKKVLLFGYMRANFGDDLFMYIMAKRYKDVTFFIHIREEKYKKAFKEINNINFIEEDRNVDDINIDDFDAFAYIGGSIFMESVYAIHEAKEFNKFLKRTNEKGKPFFYLTCNFGPWYTQEYFDMVRENFKLCQGVCFRDIDSYELFKDIPSVSYAPDIAFSHDYSEFLQKRENKKIGISVIDLSIREKLSHKGDIYNDYIKRIIIKFAKRGYKVSLISFCEFEEDKNAIEKIKKIVPEEYLNNLEELTYKGNIEEFLKEYSSFNYMVCTRFHSMILSVILRQKIYNLSYSNKIENVINDYKMFRKVDNIKDLTFETILRKYHFKRVNSLKLNKINIKSQQQFAKFEEWLKK